MHVCPPCQGREQRTFAGLRLVRVHCGVDRGASPGPPAENLETCGQARNKVIGSMAVDFARVRVH